MSDAQHPDGPEPLLQLLVTAGRRIDPPAETRDAVYSDDAARLAAGAATASTHASRLAGGRLGRGVERRAAVARGPRPVADRPGTRRAGARR